MRFTSRSDAQAEIARVRLGASKDLAVAKAETQRLCAAFDVLAHGVVVANSSGQVVYRNAVAQTLEASYGAEVLAAKVVEDLLEIARGGDAQTREISLLGPPAKTLRISAQPLPGGGGASAVIEDVTEHTRIEAMRRDFIANVSHELRTPVGALVVLAEAVRGEPDPAVARRLIELMASDAERAVQLVDELLDLSRIEAGGEGRCDDVDIQSVVASSSERAKGAAVERAVQMRIDAIPEALVVRGDESQLVSAVANLLENAVKYSERGSEVSLEVKVTSTLAGDPDGHANWVDVVVTDHGIGIPRRDLDRVFERFYRVDRARSRETGGTGLGLSIVRHVAINHGGMVTVTSREDEGSIFTLRLPLTQAPPDE